MKKLILVLLLVALLTFLLVGCTPGTVTPVTPVPTAGIACPTTVKVSDEVVIGTKTYIKGGEEKTITVTFAVPTAPVSVYVGHDIAEPVAVTTGVDLKASTVPEGADEVVMYTTDNKIYTGTFTFIDDVECETDYIYIETCGTCAACKYPYTVDSLPPTANIQICAADCAGACGGCAIIFTSLPEALCGTTTNPCGDACSGLATWNIDIYDTLLGTCCTTACGGTLLGSSSGTTCPISWTTACFNADLVIIGIIVPFLNRQPSLVLGKKTVYAYVTLVDKVGNSSKFGYTIETYQLGIFDGVTATWDTCEGIKVIDIPASIPPLDCLKLVPHVDCDVVGEIDLFLD